ncbi:unnamed protein product [Vicia faba]|uniref:SNF2 domain-containing protein CLASSY 2 n=1 Tax=Vicia faba TaxID=3906 RepID=A0AAV0YKK8_VICFA|nr:unnamed protein product [Vicia faba]
MNRKRHLNQLKNPFSSHPFEAISLGSWHPVESIKVKSGAITIHFADNHRITMDKGTLSAVDKGTLSDIRISSRKAIVSDCSRFLRPGIDICVLTPRKQANDSAGLNPEPVWMDARISSIQRKRHDSECSCQFFVNFYVDQGSLGLEMRTLCKDIKVFRLNQISILQKVDHNPCENQPYRWSSSEDCSSLPHSKLLLGKFLSDLSWLVVTSVVKKVSFSARSVENKMVYQILIGDSSTSLLSNSESHIDVVSFKNDNGMLVPIVSQVAIANTKRVCHAYESHADEASSSLNADGLRRSKRRHVQPERYLGCEVKELDVGSFRNAPPVRINTSIKEDEMSLSLACFLRLHQNRHEKNGEKSQKSDRPNTSQKLLVYNRRPKNRELKKSCEVDQNEHNNQLAIIPLPDQDADPITVEHCDLNRNVIRSNEPVSSDISLKYRHLVNTPKPRKNINLLDTSGKSGDAESSDNAFLRSKFFGSSKLQKKSLGGLDDMELGNKWERIKRKSKKGFREGKYRSTYLRNNDEGRTHNYKDRSLNATAYKDLINSYLLNINEIPVKEEPPITAQWKKRDTTNGVGQKEEAEISHGEDEEEKAELDKLWKELEVSLASSYFEESEVSNAIVPYEPEKNLKKDCEHDNRLDEEIGIYCIRCGFVTTDIRDVNPIFVEKSVWCQEEKQRDGVEDKESTKADEDDDFRFFPTDVSPDEPISEESESVWSLIPELKDKLHVHQKKAFEFLWQNIAGSTDPRLIEAEYRKRGGCVISHTPGAGKTFLIIAFLVSYLKLFPGKRPLVLAPKTTLYTWYKEFIKWEIPIPVYLIHGRRTYRVFKQNNYASLPGVPKPTDDVKHVLDCLEKIQKWHSRPSVLIMGYTSFLTLMREDSKFAHRKFMAKVLRESPGLLVLDEGHNPRSTKSRLRKVLMKVQTELRILLSGTLFQNNFCEYFNTLCLARPKFAHEVLKALDPKYRKKKKGAERKGAEKAQYLIESRARKFFLDNIAKKIDSNVGEERLQGLNMLRNATNSFIDVYEGGSSDDLPGIQIYTLLMNTTDIQHEILRKLHIDMAKCSGYPLELELLITLGSIHPWLVKTAVCSQKFLTKEQLSDLDKYKFDLKIGSKVRFVLSLIYRVVKNEKVLIFCHNIAPVRLFQEYFEKYFGWQKGREVLVLTGELELFERGKIMDKFEEPGGASKILLASITACAEGISLTAASRVIMLDSEWNPSKTKQAIARAFRPGQQKMVYVYQLLVTGSLEEDKYRRTTWKEWVSNMIFSEAFVEDPSRWQAEKIEDDILREMVEEDKSKSFHMIMKNEKASTNK